MNKNLPGFEKQEWWVKNALCLVMDLFNCLHIDHTFTQLYKIPDRDDDAILLVAQIPYSNS